MHGKLDQPVLNARGLGVRYGTVAALAHVSLRVESGELVALVGPNGAGKSSLLRAVLGLVAHDGEVCLHTDRRGRRGVAFVPQRATVDLGFPITVFQMVADGRRAFLRLGWPLRAADRQAIARALSTVGLDGLEGRALNELSGGQLQRAFIARALAQEARLLLLDEPLTGVDQPTTAALMDLLAALAEAGTAIVVSSHDLALVRERFVRCLVLNQQLVGDGPPADVLSPEHLELLFAVRG